MSPSRPRARLPAFDLDGWLASSPDVAPIVQAGTPGLRQPSLDVPRDLFATPALARLLDVMVATMRAAPGVGLAAPQIGVPLRLLVAEDDEERMSRISEEARAARGRMPLPLLFLANPTLTVTSKQEHVFYEGCLSVRGYGALVARAGSVHVEGFDPSGQRVALDLHGWPARILQHEIDHLNGTLYVDRMISRSLAADTELVRLSAMAPAEVLAEIGEAK